MLLFGAPYLPTHKQQVVQALDMLEIKKGDVLHELGCGDGRLLREAARRGHRAVGYELNPLVYLIARLSTWRYRKMVSVHYANFWSADLTKADAIYVFLLDRFMEKLDRKLSAEAKQGTLLASYAFKIPGKKPIKAQSGIFLYKY